MIDSRRTAQLGLVMAALMAGGAHALGQAVQTPYLDAEHGITIEELVSLALQHSPDVAAAVARVDIARGNVAQAALRANPSIKVGGATEIGGPDGQIVAGVSWPLELFRRDARTDAARREADVAVFDVRQREWDLAAAVRRQAGITLAAIARVGQLRQQNAAARDLRDLIAASVQTGGRPRLDQDLADLDARGLEAAVLRQDGEVRSALITLKGLIGLEPAADLTLRRSLEEELAAVTPLTAARLEDQAALASAVAARPDVARAAARISLAAAERHRAEQNGRFDIDLTADYTRTDTSFPQRGFQSDGTLAPVSNRFHMLSFGASLALPLLDRNQGAIGAATASERAAGRDRAAVDLVARTGLAAAVARWSAARQAVAIYSGGLRDLGARTLTVVQETYRLGRGSLGDVLAERRRLVEIDASYTDLLRDLYEADVDVRYALGVIR
jgi:cobalt-zinc-cadmium efflux system outer membrane protein